MKRTGFWAYGVTAAAAALLLSGCHLFSHTKTGCRAPQEYRRAQERAPLRVPAGLSAPGTQSAFVVPQVDPAAPRGPNEPCLEIPPKYRSPPPNKPLPAG